MEGMGNRGTRKGRERETSLEINRRLLYSQSVSLSG